MGLNFNLNLPGPFSYSARLRLPTREVGKAGREVSRAIDRAARNRARQNRSTRPVQPRPIQQVQPRPAQRRPAQRDGIQWDGTIWGSPNWASKTVLMILLAVNLALLVVLVPAGLTAFNLITSPAARSSTNSRRRSDRRGVQMPAARTSPPRTARCGPADRPRGDGPGRSGDTRSATGRTTA